MKTIYKIVISDRYAAGLQAVLSYGKQTYGNKATLQFSDGIGILVNGLADFPEIYQRALGADAFPDKNIREIIYKKHRILYQILDDEVHILAIYNCRQNQELQEFAI